MIQRGQHFRLALKADHALWVVSKSIGQDLENRIAVMRRTNYVRRRLVAVSNTEIPAATAIPP